MRVVSLFSGCGGLDLGFENAGFELVFANDKDKDIWETFEANHNFEIDKRSISKIKPEEIPDCEGIIGGPPCQSWSLAGAMRGIKDPRGDLFYQYIRILKEKKPHFFLAENVAGIISKTHLPEFTKIIEEFRKIGYTVSYKLLNAKELGVPQERKRVIIIGYRKDIDKKFIFPQLNIDCRTLKDTIKDLPESVPAKDKNKPNQNLEISNHEHMIGDFSTMYMSRNRKKEWHEPSFTIQAGGRHAPLHPQSKKMKKIGKDKWIFDERDKSYRRLSVRECARIQTFPDNFIFKYDNVSKGYKMIGNAVPVLMAEVLARKIKEDLKEIAHKITTPHLKQQ
jgi:DNA (cytosine-5)-methyltransferase 1